MQVSYHFNLSFLESVLLSSRSENNQEVLQKNTGQNRPAYLWLCMLNVKKKITVFFCVRNLFKDCLLFVLRSSFSFFLLQSHDEIELLSAFCAGESSKRREKTERDHVKILNVLRQGICLGCKKTHCSHFTCLVFFFHS